MRRGQQPYQPSRCARAWELAGAIAVGLGLAVASAISRACGASGVGPFAVNGRGARRG